ncbi:hypothetical protein [Caenispirillum bisanense]|uniref:hypothetical protein n=1 Tax=Caenispirillum bisanense TaxID=414052 RepID=UPI0031D06250
MGKWGASQIEFRAVWPEIKRRAGAGESLNSIFGDMRDAGRITMSRAAFYKIRKALTEPDAAPQRQVRTGRLTASTSLSPRPRPSSPPTPAAPASDNSAIISSLMPTVEHAPGMRGTDTDIWGDDHPSPDTDTTDAGAISAEGAAASVAPPSVKDTDNAE